MKKELLKLEERVKFKVGDKILNYKVTKTYLENIDNPRVNDHIFILLNLEKNDFCTKIYNYGITFGLNKGGFPETRSYDFEALTKVYNALQDLCDEYNNITKTISYGIY